MPHDVFISYSSLDKAIADAACSRLEQAGIRCWIAPRDVLPGSDWATAIVKAIEQCRVVVLIFTDHVNAPGPVWKEIERAAHHLKAILPFRVENVAPKDALEFHLSTVHWLDAITPPLEQHFAELVVEVSQLMGITGTEIVRRPTTDPPSIQGCPPAEVFPFGETKVGEIRGKGDMLYFSVPLDAGDTLLALVTAWGGVAMRPVGWTPTLEIRDPFGAKMLTQTGYPRCRLLTDSVPSGGQYSVGFGDSGNGSSGGSFSAFVQRVNRPGRAKLFRPGESVRGFVRNCGEVTTHAFEARAGDQVTLQIEQHTVQGIGPHVEVYDPGGDLFEMGESYDYGGNGIAKPVRFEATIDRDGIYTVLISSFTPEGKGGYRISLTQRRP